jgi:hypothetical protein
MKYALMTLAAWTLAACTGPLSDAPNATVAAFTDAFTDTPFEDGAAVTVLVRDTDPLRTIQSFKLVPCQGGKAVCGGSDRGTAGALTLEGRQYVVRGAYAGRDFYLDPNGDGFMGRGTVLVPLAWN